MLGSMTCVRNRCQYVRKNCCSEMERSTVTRGMYACEGVESGGGCGEWRRRWGVEEEVGSGGGGEWRRWWRCTQISTHLEWLLIDFLLFPPFTPSAPPLPHSLSLSPSTPTSSPSHSLLLTLLCLRFACSTLYVYNMLTSFFTAGREVSTLITPATGRRISANRKGERS